MDRPGPLPALWRLSCVGLSLLAACGGGGSDGNEPPVTPPAGLPDVALEAAFPDLAFASPVVLTQAPGDSTRWFVVEQRGTVRVFANDGATATSAEFVDITDRADAGFSESGLLGLAFHPGFPATPYAYLSYTVTGPGGGSPLVSRVSRFASTDGGLTLDASTEQVLLTVTQPAGNHNGGNLAFDASGLLYAGFGDGGGAGDPGDNGQDPTNLLGTIVRIDVDGGSPYAIPPTNPFAGNLACMSGSSATGNGCPEIFAWGLRNPWRFSFDRSTGLLWAGDVGQGSWEEVDVIEAGGNYGWNAREGAHCYEPPSGCGTGFIEPVAEYDHGTGQSITGGYVYRGSLLPGLVGNYVFADFISGRLLAVPDDSQPTVMPQVILDSGRNIATFAEDGSGELFVVDYSAGTIHRLVAAP